MKQTRSNRSLPEEIIEEILSWLPVKTLLRFKSASKSLRNLIIRPDFVKLHLLRSRIQNSTIILLHSGKTFLNSFDVEHPTRPVVQLYIHPDLTKLLEPFDYDNRGKLRNPKIIGICNGVVCFRKEKEFVLYNPATRAYKQVPRRLLSDAICHDDLIVYDCVSDSFKILSIIQYFWKRGEYDSETYLYNLKDNSWSKIESPTRRFHGGVSCSHIANNSLYWITFNYDSENVMLMRFDVSSHRLEEISLPIYPRNWFVELGVLKERLHMMTCVNGFDIWMLKEDNCWNRVFHCSDWEYKLSSHSLTVFSPVLYAYSKDGRKIIIGGLEKFTKVICCDLESQTISAVQVLCLPEGDTLTAIPWAESLVSLEW